jgi:hypothetical protein
MIKHKAQLYMINTKIMCETWGYSVKGNAKNKWREIIGSIERWKRRKVIRWKMRWEWGKEEKTRWELPLGMRNCGGSEELQWKWEKEEKEQEGTRGLEKCGYENGHWNSMVKSATLVACDADL